MIQLPARLSFSEESGKLKAPLTLTAQVGDGGQANIYREQEGKYAIKVFKQPFGLTTKPETEYLAA